MHIDLSAQYKTYYAAYINEIEPMTALCGAQAIDSVMGKEWFAKFKKQEVALDTKLATVKDSQKTIFSNDFQGIVKIFRYREEDGDVRNYNLQSPVLITPVFEAFKLPRKDRGRSAFSSLCDTLIANRNKVHHLGLNAANTDDANELRSNISFIKKAILDCVAFLEYFKDVTDEKGQPYIDLVYHKIEELEQNYKILRYNTLDVIQNEKMDISPEQFSQICQELYISTLVIKGVHYFESNDYEADLRAIKTVAKRSTVVINEPVVSNESVAVSEPILKSDMFTEEAPDEPEKKKNLYPVLLTLSVVLLIALVVIALLVGRTKDKAGENKVQKSSENVSADSTPQTGPLQDTDPTVTEAPETQPPATEVPTTAPAVVKISGSATHNGLTFTVDQKLSNRFVIKVKNEDACAYCFGWVNPAEIVIETTTSTYFGKVDGWGNTKIEAGSSGQLVVNIQEEIEGDIESITIQNINALNDRNLPVNGSTAGSVVDIYITYNQ